MAEEVAPLPSATLLMLRDGPGGLEVLMTTRNRGAVFAGGALVFPGGKVDPGDHSLAGSADPVPIAAIAAIRETFEEAGMLLVESDGGNHRIPQDTIAGLRASGMSFGPLLAEFGLRPATDRLVRFAHWITPRDRARRFDTHFFLAEAPEGQEAIPDGREAMDALWIAPQIALDAAAEGKLKLVFATHVNLRKLSRFASARACIAAARSAPIVTVLPEFVEIDGIAMLRIPEEAGYGFGTIRSDAFEPAIGKAK